VSFLVLSFCLWLSIIGFFKPIDFVIYPISQKIFFRRPKNKFDVGYSFGDLGYLEMNKGLEYFLNLCFISGSGGRI
jgi:hypothetical protein